MCLEILACPLVCLGHQFFETSWSKGMHARLIVTLNWLHTWVRMGVCSLRNVQHAQGVLRPKAGQSNKWVDWSFCLLFS